jgi:RimJ/RimL family protein N-acetyltransferase
VSAATAPPNPPLSGEHVRLEPLGRQHAEALRALAVDAPQTFRWMFLPLGEWFDDWFAAALSAPDEGPYATVDARTGAVVGSTRFMAYRPADRGVEIGGTWLHPTAQRTGINVEAKLLMLEHAFTTMGCIRVELKTHAGNARSRAAIEGIGATFEGVHRKHMMRPGIGVRDSAWFSIVDDEWPAVRARLRARLRPPAR